MSTQFLVNELKAAKDFLDRGTRCFEEEHSGFAPTGDLFTTAQQVAHIAQTIDWFREGAFRPEGFSMDFEGFNTEVKKITSLAEARAWSDRAFAEVIEAIGSRSLDELNQPLPDGPIMGGLPRLAIIGAIADHTAHHRGALSVYARLQGLTPPMPYMDM